MVCSRTEPASCPGPAAAVKTACAPVGATPGLSTSPMANTMTSVPTKHWSSPASIDRLKGEAAPPDRRAQGPVWLVVPLHDLSGDPRSADPMGNADACLPAHGFTIAHLCHYSLNKVPRRAAHILARRTKNTRNAMQRSTVNCPAYFCNFLSGIPFVEGMHYSAERYINMMLLRGQHRAFYKLSVQVITLGNSRLKQTGLLVTMLMGHPRLR